MANFQKPMIISTGASDFSEVEKTFALQKILTIELYFNVHQFILQNYNNQLKRVNIRDKFVDTVIGYSATIQAYQFQLQHIHLAQG